MEDALSLARPLTEMETNVLMVIETMQRRGHPGTSAGYLKRECGEKAVKAIAALEQLGAVRSIELRWDSVWRSVLLDDLSTRG